MLLKSNKQAMPYLRIHTKPRRDGWNKKAGQTNRQKYTNTPCQDRTSRCIVDQQPAVEYPRLFSSTRLRYTTSASAPSKPPASRKQEATTTSRGVQRHTKAVAVHASHEKGKSTTDPSCRIRDAHQENNTVPSKRLLYPSLIFFP